MSRVVAEQIIVCSREHEGRRSYFPQLAARVVLKRRQPVQQQREAVRGLVVEQVVDPPHGFGVPALEALRKQAKDHAGPEVLLRGEQGAQQLQLATKVAVHELGSVRGCARKPGDQPWRTGIEAIGVVGPGEPRRR